MSFVGRSVPRLEDRPLVTGRGPLRRRCGVSAYAAHARRALGPCAWPHRVDRRQRGAGVARRRRGLDLRRRRRHPADRFPADPHRRTGALPPDHPGAAARALCRRAGRGRVRDRSLSGRGCGRPRRGRDRGAAGHSRRQRDARRVRGRPLDRAGDRGKVLRRRGRGVPRRACGGRARARDRAAFRRADGDARRDRALRRRQRRAGNARRRQGAALEPRQHRPHARPRSFDRAPVRRSCRRRLRHPRRALSRGRAGLPRRAAARPAGEVDRGPARAPDRRQSFAPAAAQGARRGRRRRAASSPSTTNSSTTRAAMCAPTRPRCPTSPPRCCRDPIACRPIGRSGMSGSPTRRRAAPIGRPAGSRARSCASA